MSTINYVYHALDTQYSPAYPERDDGLTPSDPYSNATPDEAIAENMPSKYIHTTTNPFVALYYAKWWFVNSKDGDISRQKIVMIDLQKVMRCNSATNFLMVFKGEGLIDKEGKAANFARKHQEVLIEGNVPSHCIVNHISTDNIYVSKPKPGAPMKIDDFFDALPFETSMEFSQFSQEFEPPRLTNDATNACMDDSYVFGEGTHKLVYRSKYTKGERAGFCCVTKCSKSGEITNNSFWQTDLNAVAKAKSIITEVQRIFSSTKFRIHMSDPEVFYRIILNSAVLLEPMIPKGKWRKWNSNTGYSSGFDIMDALSHFSYHYTQGECLLCDLQGGRFDMKDGTTHLVLTDPVLMSKSGEYGASDLGQDGISNFFYHHECGPYCNWGGDYWSLPNHVYPYFTPKLGTETKDAVDAALAGV